MWIDRMKLWASAITVENLETRQESTMHPSRGRRLKLKKFRIGDTGLHRGCCFQFTGKNYIYFVSKKPVYADNIVGMAKRVRLNDGEDVYIYVDEEHTRGIRARFDAIGQEPVY